MQKLRDKVRKLLADGKVAGYIGYKMVEAHPLPYFFTKDRLTEVDEAIVAPGDARYPLDKLLLQVAARYPKDAFAIQVRGCDERGLIELYKWGQLDTDQVVLVGVACPDRKSVV